MITKPIIALVGSAAVGKSSLLPNLAKTLGLPCFNESADENPILTQWYLDPPTWNYWVQLFFHSRRVVSQYLAEKTGGLLERTLYEDLIFFDLALADAKGPTEHEKLLAYKQEIDQILSLHRPLITFFT